MPHGASGADDEATMPATTSPNSRMNRTVGGGTSAQNGDVRCARDGIGDIDRRARWIAA